MAMHLPSAEEVEPPEAMRLYWICRTMNGMWEAGGVGDQPHVLMMEFLTVRMAENEYEEEDRRIKEQFEALKKAIGV